jgi:catechol-2,3-dioxygenase
MIKARMVVPTVPVTDLERAKEFYGNILGLEFLWETGLPKGSSSSTTAKDPLTTTDHIAQLGPARGAWFRDPDGNTLGLRQG